MQYSARMVANAIMVKANTQGNKLNHMKLQKLMFFMYAWSLALNDTKLTIDAPMASEFGPVFESVYHELQSKGSGSLSEMLSELNPVTGKFTAMMPHPDDLGFYSLLQNVWERYSKFSSLELSALAHEADGPWDKARKAEQIIILDEWFIEHYRNKLDIGGPGT